MERLTLRLLFLLSLHFLGLSLLSQKHFKLTVNLPQSINPEQMEIWLNNGKEAKKIKPQSVTREQMIVAGDYYSVYAAINLQYPSDANSKSFAKEFFVGEKPGLITFPVTRQRNSPFENYSLQNVFDFEKDKQQMDDYTVAERKKAMDYEARYGDALFGGNDTAIRNRYFKILMPALGRKKLKYIVAHPKSYYSFYSFRTAVAKPNTASWDSLLRVFNRFPYKFKYSDEGNYLNAFLHGGLLAGETTTAVDFTAKDIYKKKVSLSQFKGSKCVLLHFWATWCTPCMRELPALKEINDQYAANDLQIISIALKSSDAEYLKAIKKYRLRWIHIYNDVDLLNKYGNQPTPRICLVDKTGKLVYDNIGLGKNDDSQLNGLKEKLKEVVHE